MVLTRTLDGEIAFQANHAPFLGVLTENHTKIFLVEGGVQDVAVHGGFVEVSNNKVSILSDGAELADEIDVDRARRERDRADEMARHEDDGEAEAALRRAHARLSAVGGLGATGSAATH